MINLVAVHLSVAKFGSRVSYDRPDIGLPLFLLKLNSLIHKVWDGKFSLHYGVRGYECLPSVSLSCCNDLHRDSPALRKNSLNFHFSLCGSQVLASRPAFHGASMGPATLPIPLAA